MKFSEEFKKTKEYQEMLENNRKYYQEKKESRKKQMREYWNAKKDEMKKYKKSYYENNKEYVKEKTKEYREENPEKVKAFMKDYYEKHKSTLGPSNRERNKIWYSKVDKEEYRKKKRDYENERRARDPQFAIKKRLRLRVWQAFKGVRKKSSDELGIDYDVIVNRLQNIMPGDYNQNPDEYQIDHIQPLCSFDLTNDEEVKKAFAPENHCWIKTQDHLSKSVEDRKKTIHVAKPREPKTKIEIQEDSKSKDVKIKKAKEVPYMEKELLDTTFSSIWLFRGNNPDKNKFNNIVLEDPIGNMTDISTVRTKGGINYYSKFNPIVADNIISYWSKEGETILDPFSGRTRAMVSAIKNRNYYGFEIASDVHKVVMEAIETNKDKLPLIPIVYNDDSNNLDLDKYKDIQADLIFSCPPYFNIEKYPSSPGQLSDIEDYDKFLIQFREIMQKSCNHLKPGKYVALVVGDFRIGGKFYNFHGDVINIMNSIRVPIHDVIIRQSVTLDRACVRFGACLKTKTVAKVHEYLLIFKKPW